MIATPIMEFDGIRPTDGTLQAYKGFKVKLKGKKEFDLLNRRSDGVHHGELQIDDEEPIEAVLLPGPEANSLYCLDGNRLKIVIQCVSAATDIIEEGRLWLRSPAIHILGKQAIELRYREGDKRIFIIIHEERDMDGAMLEVLSVAANACLQNFVNLHVH